jgi:hypothetical protein
MVVGSIEAGTRGKRSVLSTEKPKICTDEGDLYVVRNITESLALYYISIMAVLQSGQALTRQAKQLLI